MKLTNLTYGSDFEMAVRRISDGKIVTCPVEFGGTKQIPLSIGYCEFGECFRQIDGCFAEFNIPVVTNLVEWVTAYEYCKDKGNEILLPLGLELVAITSHVFDKDQLTQDRHLEFGCEPSFCAYDWNTLSPDSSQAGNLRTTGAHIHMGFTMPTDFGGDYIQRLMFCMDKCVGIPALDRDEDRRRRKLYGKAGEYRIKFLLDGEELSIKKAHKASLCIIEYRSLGGKLVNEPVFMFEATQKAIELFNSDYEFSTEEIKAQRDYINHEYKEELNYV